MGCLSRPREDGFNICWHGHCFRAGKFYQAGVNTFPARDYCKRAREIDKAQTMAFTFQAFFEE